MGLDDTASIKDLFNGPDAPKVYMDPQIQSYLGLTDAQILGATGFSNVIITDPAQHPALGDYLIDNALKPFNPIERFLVESLASDTLTEIKTHFLDHKNAGNQLKNNPVFAIISLKNSPTKEAADSYYTTFLNQNLAGLNADDPAVKSFNLGGVPPVEFARITFYHEASHVAQGHGKFRLKPDENSALNALHDVRGENEADIRGIQKYLADSASPEERAQRLKAVEVWHDVRAIGTMNDLIASSNTDGHSTNLYFDPGPHGPRPEFQGQENKDEALSRKVHELTFEAGEILRDTDILPYSFPLNNPAQTNYIVISALDRNGAFDNDPMAKEMVKEYLEAMERRLPSLVHDPFTQEKITALYDELPDNLVLPAPTEEKPSPAAPAPIPAPFKP